MVGFTLLSENLKFLIYIYTWEGSKGFTDELDSDVHKWFFDIYIIQQSSNFLVSALPHTSNRELSFKLTNPTIVSYYIIDTKTEYFLNNFK